MKEFIDLEFRDKGYMGGKLASMEFPNGYGISVVSVYGSYSNAKSPYEIAVLHGGEICYDTEITSDVIGYLTPEEVTEYMKQIQAL